MKKALRYECDMNMGDAQDGMVIFLQDMRQVEVNARLEQKYQSIALEVERYARTGKGDAMQIMKNLNKTMRAMKKNDMEVSRKSSLKGWKKFRKGFKKQKER